MKQVGYGQKSQLRLLQLRLLCEDVQHELKCFVWTELCDLCLEFVLIEHLQVKYVIDEAYQEVDLSDDHANHLAVVFVFDTC